MNCGPPGASLGCLGTGLLFVRTSALLPLLLSVTVEALTDVDEDVRWPAANALDHGDGPRVLPQLLQLVVDDDPDIRRKVVCALPTLVSEAGRAWTIPLCTPCSQFSRTMTPMSGTGPF